MNAESVVQKRIKMHSSIIKNFKVQTVNQDTDWISHIISKH